MINVADLVIFVVLLFGAWRGLRHGLSGEILRVAVLVAAFLIGARTHVLLGERIAETTRLSAAASRALGFGAAFLAVWIAGNLARIALLKILTLKFVRPLELVGGAAAGAIKAAAAVSAVLIFANLAPRLRPLADAVNERSAVCAFLSTRAPALYSSLRERYADIVGEEHDGEAAAAAPAEDAEPAAPEDVEPPSSAPEWEPLVFDPVKGAGGNPSNSETSGARR